MIDEIQRIQTAHRRKIQQSWGIALGTRVLEVGCGQGDLTAVLAEAVGHKGHVTAVDVAGPDYGAPMTLGEATAKIKASPIGSRIDFRLEFDLLNTDFAPTSYDYAVLAHSLWYFASRELLTETLGRLRLWAKRLCFAEWDLETRSVSQVPHLLAVLVQGQIEAFKDRSDSNVRTPLSVGVLRSVIEGAGWVISSESLIESDDLQDADWEISHCLKSALGEAKRLAMPARLFALVETELDLLRCLAKPSGNRPLGVYCGLAWRSTSDKHPTPNT